MSSAAIDVRRHVERLAAPRRGREALPFGLDEIDRVLPGGGLASGVLHGVAGGGNGAVHGAAAALFAAGIAARTRGKVLWAPVRSGPCPTTPITPWRAWRPKIDVGFSLPRTSTGCTKPPGAGR